MVNRAQLNQMLFFAYDDKKSIMKAKMAQLSTEDMGAYPRKVPISELELF